MSVVKLWFFQFLFVLRRQNSRTMVYNYVAPRNQTLTWKKFLDIVFNCAKKYPPSEAIYYCDVKIYESPIARWLAGIFFESIPLMIMDLYSRYLLKKDVRYITKLLSLFFHTFEGNYLFTLTFFIFCYSIVLVKLFCE